MIENHEILHWGLQIIYLSKNQDDYRIRRLLENNIKNIERHHRKEFDFLRNDHKPFAGDQVCWVKVCVILSLHNSYNVSVEHH